MIAAIKNNHENGSFKTYNVGTGVGTSVLELIDTLNDVLISKGRLPIQYQIGDKRSGDLDINFAVAEKIFSEIGFRTEYDIRKMCEDGLTFIGL